jgi:hypothetical protein
MDYQEGYLPILFANGKNYYSKPLLKKLTFGGSLKTQIENGNLHFGYFAVVS